MSAVVNTKMHSCHAFFLASTRVTGGEKKLRDSFSMFDLLARRLPRKRRWIYVQEWAGKSTRIVFPPERARFLALSASRAGDDDTDDGAGSDKIARTTSACES